MHLKNVFIRFYKSFNFDYLRKFDPKVSAHLPWESIDGLWYPYVRIPIDSKITTVVGANESGKTHLLTAIEKGIRGEDICRDDFCRYSQFFTVENGKLRWPDFGFEFSGLSSQERQSVSGLLGITRAQAFDSFIVFRTDKDTLTGFIPSDAGYSRHEIEASTASQFANLVPNVFRLHENVGLPESASIRWLASKAAPKSSVEQLPRNERVLLLDTVLKHFGWFSTKETVTKSAEQIAETFSGYTLTGESGWSAFEKLIHLV